jgi:hypothetical protein
MTAAAVCWQIPSKDVSFISLVCACIPYLHLLYALANYTNLQCVTAVHRSSAPSHSSHNKHPSHVVPSPLASQTPDSNCHFLCTSLNLQPPQPRSLDHQLHILSLHTPSFAYSSTLDAFDSAFLCLRLERPTSLNDTMKLAILLTLVTFMGLGLAAPTIHAADLDTTISNVFTRSSDTNCDECHEHRNNCLKV